MHDIKTETIRPEICIPGDFKEKDLKDVKILRLNVLIYWERRKGRGKQSQFLRLIHPKCQKKKV